MKKGFLFTLDAVLALILVIILATALAMQQNALPEKGGISDTLRQQAEDRAITEFYLGNSVLESLSGVDYEECAVIYTLNPNNGAGRDEPDKQQFCEKP